VTSMTINAFPAIPAERTAWLTTLFFSPDKLVQLAQAIQDLPLLPEQYVFLVMAGSGPPTNEPCILVNGFLHKGTEESGRAAFASLYALDPAMEISGVKPYTEWNTGGDMFCHRGGRKAAYSTSLRHMQPEKMPEVWELYKGFQAKGPNTAILIERYSLDKASAALAGDVAVNERVLGESFAQAVVVPWYEEEGMDGEAEEFGRRVRGVWSGGDDARDSLA
jgi:hypothetical protein